MYMTKFTFKFGTFHFEIKPSGMMNALATFQRMMKKVLK